MTSVLPQNTIPTPVESLPDDERYQDAILQGVSRTFALTIPQLPGHLRTVVGNAYLLCRIADSIEDATALSIDQKRAFCDQFVRVVVGNASADEFGRELAPLLITGALDAERDLIANAARVIRLTRSFSDEERAALGRCVRIMAEGMEDFQEGRFTDGLRDMAHLDGYCYHVAGVVGEMLTDLFCAYSKDIAARRDDMRRLAVSFGQGLQMTNILKDIWEDKKRGVCWLPQDVFTESGFDLHNLSDGPTNPAFHKGLRRLVGVARHHLHNALTYTLLIPKSEPGIRRFCIWAIAMAVLTLRNINSRPSFTAGQQVKISRSTVRATLLISSLIGGHNTLHRTAFGIATFGLPK